jgi:hypothetical protein
MSKHEPIILEHETAEIVLRLADLLATNENNITVPIQLFRGFFYPKLLKALLVYIKTYPERDPYNRYPDKYHCKPSFPVYKQALEKLLKEETT